MIPRRIGFELGVALSLVTVYLTWSSAALAQDEIPPVPKSSRSTRGRRRAMIRPEPSRMKVARSSAPASQSLSQKHLSERRRQNNLLRNK